MRKVGAGGPTNAEIMIVGEAPGEKETYEGRPFVGESGKELDHMLHEAGILRGECYLTNAVKFRPPDNEMKEWVHFVKAYPKKYVGEQLVHFNGAWVHPHVRDGVTELLAEIARVNPNIIIAVGNTPLWALTNQIGIASWRGSLIKAKTGHKLLPTYHPAAVLRNWEYRPISIHDLKRARRESYTRDLPPNTYRFSLRPSFEAVMDCISMLQKKVEQSPTRLALDIETRNGDIACLGIAWNKDEAICIPFQSVSTTTGQYWSLDEHVEIRNRLRALLAHANCLGAGQNFSYDQQYFMRRMFFLPNITDDTMVAQHVLLPGLPKGLDFLSSMYCENHVYWKDEGKEWNPREHDEERLWKYNCEDAARTYEIIEALLPALEKAKIKHLYDFQMSLFYPVMRIVGRGIRMNIKNRADMDLQLFKAINERQEFIDYVVGHPLNIRSPKQMQEFLYEEMRLPAVHNRKAKKKDGSKPITANDEALEKCAAVRPILKPVIERIQAIRTMGVFRSTFVKAPIDADDRIRCTFQIAGPETYRFSSSENSFGGGTNLQNIPRIPEDDEPNNLPNIRTLFIPDNGYEIADVDLSGADAMVVAWECDDQVLKEIMLKKLKLAAENAKMIYGALAGPDGKKEPYYTKAKMGCHATNYGAKPPTVAAAIGITIHEAEQFQKRWFDIHPNIAKWHKDVANRINTTRTVSNKFGYRRIYFDRPDLLLPQALAWIPQSTVACVINRALVGIDANVPKAQILMQVHDSLVFQYKIEHRQEVLKGIRDNMKITVPYLSPLVITSDLKTSLKSWGECEKTAWPE